MTRRWLISSIAAALTLLGGVVSIVESQPEGSMEPLGMAWSRPFPRAVALAVSPRGERVIAADARGVVRCWDGRGSPVWERQLADTDSLATSSDGSLSAAWALRQPLARSVTFLDSEGKTLGTYPAREPVEAAMVSSDGTRLAIAAGKSLVFGSRRSDGLHFREARLGSAPRQVQFGPGDTLFVSCEKPPCVLLVKSSGKVVWKLETRSVAAPSISASADGKLLAVATADSDNGVLVSMLDWRRRPLWSVSRPGRSPCIRISSTGQAALLSYEHRVEHGAERRFERRLAYLAADSNGSVQESWTKGGAYTAPLYLSVEPKGDWVVALDTQQPGQPIFRLYGRDGERRWLYASSADVLIAAGAAEGRAIATYHADGTLTLVRVAVP